MDCIVPVKVFSTMNAVLENISFQNFRVNLAAWSRGTISSTALKRFMLTTEETEAMGHEIYIIPPGYRVVV
jgi:hypothetical protein